MNANIILLFFTFLILAGCSNDQVKNTYNERAEQILLGLSTDEKLAQLKNYSFATIEHFVGTYGEVNHDSLKKYFPFGIGGINLGRDLEPEMYIKIANSIQEYNKTTRHKIPAMLIGEGLHGLMLRGATMYPQAIALGCSWDPVLLEQVYSATAAEASARGVKQLLSPVLDLARDPRFGRTEEMYSEDPYLAAMCGKAAVLGFQGRTEFPDSNHVAATLKHFVGHGQPEGGRNVAPVNISTYDLLNEHVYPFEVCIQAGVMSVMPSYNEINGLPNHGNKWLLNDLLCNQLSFNGLITADQNAIDEMFLTHSIVGSKAEAGKLALECGVDIDLRYRTGTYDEIKPLFDSGLIDIKHLDRAVKHLLILKLQLGLFEAKPADVNKLKEVNQCRKHIGLALESAEKSLVLLKNQGNVLPVDTLKLKTIAVIGPLAKGAHFGGYTAEPRHGVDVLEGIEQFSNKKFNVLYAEGCKIAKEESSFWHDNVQTPNDEELDKKLIAEAVKIARQSDVIILAIGETVSFCREAWGENHLGDRDDLNLLGRQDELVRELQKTQKPIVVLMFGGRPLSFNYVNETCPAIIQVFYPGQQGGNAIANVLFGRVNPSGKLSVTIPKSVGQIPCNYNRKPSRKRSYIYNVGSKPLYPFGFGLSYTNYVYSEMEVDKSQFHENDTVKVSVKVTNNGKMFGEEIVQLYIRDVVSAGVRPIMELKDFARVPLHPGETKSVVFYIHKAKLAYYNPQLKKVTDPGKFEIMIGSSSIDLQSAEIELN